MGVTCSVGFLCVIKRDAVSDTLTLFQPVCCDVYIQWNQVLDDIKKNNGPNNFLFTLGYSGWDKNQLKNEIKNGDWLIVPADTQSIFKKNDSEKWSAYSSLVGFNLNDLSGEPGKA